MLTSILAVQIRCASCGTLSTRVLTLGVIYFPMRALVSVLLAPPSTLHKQCPPSPEPPRSTRSSSSSSLSIRRGFSTEPKVKRDHDHNPAASVSMSYSDFLHQEFGDAQGRDNRRMKELRDERKVT